MLGVEQRQPSQDRSVHEFGHLQSLNQGQVCMSGDQLFSTASCENRVDGLLSGARHNAVGLPGGFRRTTDTDILNVASACEGENYHIYYGGFFKHKTSCLLNTKSVQPYDASVGNNPNEKGRLGSGKHQRLSTSQHPMGLNNLTSSDCTTI